MTVTSRSCSLTSVNFPKEISSALAEYSEMMPSENFFLHSLVQETAPKKILEVGVAAGGSSLVILHAIKERNDCRFFSFDISPHYYRDAGNNVSPKMSRPTGFLVSELMPDEKDCVIPLRNQNGLAGCLEEIGKDIDFCLLDTAHALPGEVIDFLCVLPYLKDGCQIVLHDINLNCLPPFEKCPDYYPIACRVLYNAVTADEKTVPGWSEYPLPNIGAFRISEETRANVADIFNSLLVNWTYIPSAGFLETTRAHLEKHYSAEMLAVFDAAVKHGQTVLLVKEAKHLPRLRAKYRRYKFLKTMTWGRIKEKYSTKFSRVEEKIKNIEEVISV